jgi:hypothetical protein
MEWKPNRVAAAILTATVGMLIAYPLSIGPVAFLGQLVDLRGDGDSYPAAELAMWFYWPILHLPDPVHNWAVEWWNCGVRLALQMAGKWDPGR